jgi:tetrapyrrole methylase family protein/MazG family protein
MASTHTITVVGLGAGNAGDLTRRAWHTLENASVVYLRTERHPCVPDLPRRAYYESFDALYETYDDFTDVYNAICDRLLTAARDEDVVYAVPGDPLVGETTVMQLLARAAAGTVNVEIVHGISFIEPMLRHTGIDALDGLQILDGMTLAAMHHPPINPQYPAFISGVYSRAVASDVKLTLMNQYHDRFMVTLVHGAGTASAVAETVPLAEMDHSRAISHLTSLYVPALGRYTSFESFQETMAHLRAPEGCPWDIQQTHETLRPYLIEEAYEVLAAIDAQDWDELASELGDLLLQVVFHAQIATEDGAFTMADVLDRINRKLIRRHPHVWGDVDVQGSPDRVLANWEEIKKQERASAGKVRDSVLDKVNTALPALMVAYEYQKQAAKVGFDWPDMAGVEDKIREELNEILTSPSAAHKIAEIGDLLFVVVNWLRWLGVDDPESLLRSTNLKFYRRFRYVEQQARAAGKELQGMTLAEMDLLWDEAKRLGR